MKGTQGSQSDLNFIRGQETLLNREAAGLEVLDDHVKVSVDAAAGEKLGQNPLQVQFPRDIFVEIQFFVENVHQIVVEQRQMRRLRFITLNEQFHFFAFIQSNAAFSFIFG